MTKFTSLFKFFTLTLLTALIVVPANADTYYKISVAKQWHQTMSTVPTTAAAIGGYVFGLNSSASDASTTFYYSHATYNSSEGKAGENNGTNGSGTITAPYISEKACAVDEAGHFLFGKPYNSGRGIRWVYVFQPASNGKTMEYLGAITLSKDGTDYTGSYANNSEGECLAITASGDVTKEGGKIYLCPKGKNYMYRFTCAGGYTTVKTVKKYTYSPSSVKNGDYASFRWYATDTGLLNASNNGVTDKNGCYKCVFSGSTATLTDFDGNSGTVVSGNSWRQGAYNSGATAFKIRGHLILVGAVNELDADPKKSMAFWDITDGDPSSARRIIDYATMGSWPSAPYMWQNAIKASDDQWDVYTYFKTGRSACYKVSASAATVSAPTVSLAAGTYNNNQTCTITWTTPVTINGKSMGVTLYYSTNNGSSYSSATGGSKAITISGTCTVKAYCQLTGYDNTSSTVTRTYTMKCATPTFSTSGGGTSPTTVTISSATSGATIYYTTDGSTPTTSSSSLANGGSFTCSTAGIVIIKAIAVKSNYTDSDVGSTTVTYNPQLAAPTFSVASGTQFTSMGTVTITAPSGSMLYYSINGEAFKSASDIAVTLTISEATSLAAYATRANYTTSTTATASYTVKCATPTFSPAGGTYSTPQSVKISCATPGTTVYYTTDGSTPTTSSAVYSAPLTVNDGSATSEYIPAYIMYADEYFKSEHIIPASSLTSMGASASSAVTINSLMWYLNGVPNNLGTARFKVFLKEVSGTTLSDFSGPTGGTVVYEGELNPTQTTMTVAFTTPFEYHGGNLLVGVYSNATGDYGSVYFSGVTTSDNCAGYGSSSSLGSVTFHAQQFLPKTTFTYTPTPLLVSQTTTIKAMAAKTNCVNSDVASATYTINAVPTGNVSNVNLAYSANIGKSTNNPTADLIRYDGTLTFNRPTEGFNGWTLDSYIITITDGTRYAQNVSGATFNALSVSAGNDATMTIPACNFKVGSTYTVSVTPHYTKSGETPYDVAAVPSNFSLTPYATYPVEMSVMTYVSPRQPQNVWWEGTGESHTYYFDSYRVELTIDNSNVPASTVPVSYYLLQMSKNHGSTWENVVDRTIDNVLDPTENPATTYPTGQGLAAGRFKGNTSFNSSVISFYYVFDVTNSANSVGTLSTSDPTQANPADWMYRITAVYGAGEDLTTAAGDPVTTDATMIQYSDGVASSSPATDAMNTEETIIITSVDGVGADSDVKEVRYFDLKGVQLKDVPQNGFYIEVRLHNDGRIETAKRVAR